MAITQSTGYLKRLSEPRLEGIEVELSPDWSFKELNPKQIEGAGPAFLWHDVPKPEGATVTLKGLDATSRKLRLRVEAEDNRWNPKWVRWSYPVRQASELQGGDSLSAQDQLLQGDQVLELMLMAGESRSVSLSFLAYLDGETATGDYSFDVVVEDITDTSNGAGAVVTTAGMLRLTHPESRLLNDLPAIYRDAMMEMREDLDGYTDPPFFERFLLGFDDSFTQIQSTLNHLDRLFGPYSTPPDFLLWLGTWVAMPLDENWPEMRRRKLIKEAVNLYRWRGTKRGLSRYLEIYCGVKPDIQDQQVEGMRLGPDAKLGAKNTILGDVPAHTFVVTISVPDLKSINEQTVHDIIRYEKPAHTAYALRIVQRAPGE